MMNDNAKRPLPSSSSTSAASDSVAPASTAPAFQPRLCHGGCVCGAVRFEATVDFSAGTTRCNCTFCAKTSIWGVKVKPEDFQLLSGEDSLSDFQRNGKFAHMLFCKHCGARPFSRGDAPWMGGPYVAININCLEDVDLTGVEIRHFDGLHNNWENPRLERHAGPM